MHALFSSFKAKRGTLLCLVRERVGVGVVVYCVEVGGGGSLKGLVLFKR